MPKRFVTIWFRYLITDWVSLRQPTVREIPFVVAAPDHGRLVITSANALAQAEGIDSGMVVADARVILPSLQVFNDKPELAGQLLHKLAEWCIRYTPHVAIDNTNGLILDASGCAHLWGGEEKYLEDIINRLKGMGYTVHAAIADTIGAAWALSRFGKNRSVINNGQQHAALLPLPPESLRLDKATIDRLYKLGLRHISDFIAMPRVALRRRFGPGFLQRLDQALGHEEEIVQTVQPVAPYQERLPCLEPIVTAAGIEIALLRLLETICDRLKNDGKGLRSAIFKGFRIDGKVEKIEIGTNRATHNTRHLLKLFEDKIATIEPALGIEVFALEAPKVDDVSPVQEKIWNNTGGLGDIALSELLDRLEGRFGEGHIHRYLPDEHYWPERSARLSSSLEERSETAWRTDKPRPLQLLRIPERIEVTAPIPDYPPMLFRYKGKLHKITRADGPERIEQEWWLQDGEHRDYYYVEDEEGCRYWLFRSGHYTGDRSHQWFLHGFFA